MRTHKIPTAEARTFSNSREAFHYCERLKFPIVIKADGLALGKGVIVAKNAEEGRAAVEAIKPVSATLAGELSSRNFCTARNVRCMPWPTEKVIFFWNHRAITSEPWMAIKARTRVGWALLVQLTIGTANCNRGSIPK